MTAYVAPYVGDTALGYVKGAVAQTLAQLYTSTLGFTPAYDYDDFTGNYIPETFEQSDWNVLQSGGDTSISGGVIEKTGAATTRFRADYSFASTIPSGSRIRLMFRNVGDASWSFFVRGGSNQGYTRLTQDGEFWFSDDIVANDDKTSLRVEVNAEASLGSVHDLTLQVVDVAGQAYDIILYAGQSNMQGGSSNSLPSPAIDIPHPLIDIRQTAFTGGFGQDDGNITRACSPIMHYTLHEGVGTAMEFARYYAENILAPGRKVLMVPYARGATRLVGTNATWNVSALTGTPVFDCLVDLVATIGSVGSSIGAGSEFKAFVWCQGESDDNPTDRAVYPTDFSNLVSRIRTETSEANLPVVIQSLNTDPAAGYLNMVDVQQKLDKDSGDATAISNCIHSDYDASWPIGSVDGDVTHFTTEANRLRGVQAAKDLETRFGL